MSAEDVSFAAYNILECRSNKIASFPLNATISKKGFVVAIDLYPYSGGPALQTIFTIRNIVTNEVSLEFFFTSDGLFNMLMYPLSGSYFVFSGDETGYTGLSPLNFGKLNHNSHLFYSISNKGNGTEL